MAKGVAEEKIGKQALYDKIEAAEQAMLAKSQFLSVMSHEMLTPMNAIVGFTNLLLENPRDDQLESLRIVKFSATNLLVLIQDLLDFHSIEAGNVTLKESDVDLNELLSDVVATHQEDANRKGIVLCSDLEPAIGCQIIADATRLAQVLHNLISNAIKFTLKGRVNIKVRLKKQFKKQVSIYFEVTDTGIGIAKSKQQLIFEHFSQVHFDAARKYGGTGLGLAITNRLLELMGSRIKVNSSPGAGSSFYFTAKFLKGDLPTSVPENTRNKISSLTGMKVLLVDDNPINVCLATNFLKKWDVDFAVAGNGEEGLAEIQRNDYHLVLMDLQMPVMDGYQATKAIRSLPNEKYKRLPIVALTASIEFNMEEKTRKVGMNDCIRKPFKPDELYQKIAVYFPQFKG